ncbi:hypothetical protein [Streptomyces sp. NPDC088910]|uniref:hypothetical protein n=1 Tax=Streptomyces sp. NPDC088910 TaxID=3365911 RepID=UPI003822B0F9
MGVRRRAARAQRMTALDPAVRAALARELLAALAAYCPGSRTRLRGSLASGTADAYSDIDLEWTVPGDRFAHCVDTAAVALGRVRPLASLRVDPESAAAMGERLLFAAFRGLPLFWRLDLSVRAEPAGSATVPAAPATAWSPAASALANAVATVKMLRRGRPDAARGLLTRGLARVGAPDHLTDGALADVLRLAAAAVAYDPSQAGLAAAVSALAEERPRP